MQKFITILLMSLLVACNEAPSKQEQQQQLPQTDSNTAVPAEPVLLKDSAANFDTYCNARFGYCIEYPTDIFHPQPESDNGDGRVFFNTKGEEVLRVYGRINTNADGDTVSLQQQMNDDMRRIKEENYEATKSVTYKKLGTDFFVLSG